MRAAIWNEFLQRYKWLPGREEECLKLFERRAVRQFAGILWEEKRRARAELASVHKAKETSGAHRSNRHAELNEEDAREEPEDQQSTERSQDDDPLQWKSFPPAWMYPNWWARLCEYWAKEEVLVMSSHNRKNRCAGGHAFHTTGSQALPCTVSLWSWKMVGSRCRNSRYSTRPISLMVTQGNLSAREQSELWRVLRSIWRRLVISR